MADKTILIETLRLRDNAGVKRIAKELVDMAQGRTTSAASHAKSKARAFIGAYNRREPQSVEDYRRAVKLAAVTNDRDFLAALKAAASSDSELSKCVNEWAGLFEPGDSAMVDLAEDAPHTQSVDYVVLRGLLQDLIDQVRKEPSSVIDLVKAAADDPTLKLVLEVVVRGDEELERLARAAEEALFGE